MKKNTAAIVLAVAALLSAPAAAVHAAGYVPASNITVIGTPASGATTLVEFGEGSFAAGEPVGVGITGAGAATLGALPMTTVSKQYEAAVDGAVAVRVGLPVGASGSYAMIATGVESGNVGTATLTVVPADAAASRPGAADGELAFTGSTVSALALWTASGALAFGVGLVVLRRSVRKTGQAA